MPRIALEGKSPIVRLVGIRLSWLGLISASLLAVGLVACARSRPSGTPQLPTSLSGFHSGPISHLTLDDVASDALDTTRLRNLLRASGFTAAAVRAFSAGMGGPVRTVRVEVVSFERAVGADAYLSWLREHAAEFVGQVRAEPALDPPGAFVLSHAPSGCCSKEQPVWVAGWRSGSDAIWIQVMGPDVQHDRVGQLVDEVETSV